MPRRVAPRAAGVRTTTALREAVDQVATSQEGAFAAGGQLLKEQTLAATSNTELRHNLKRHPVGYLVTRLEAGGGAAYPARVSWDKSSITLYNASATDSEVDLWVW